MKTGTPPRTAYDVITERIIQALEAGTAPWRKPWSSAGPARNIKGNAYRGINQFLLQLMPFDNPTFLTFRQAKALGGQVRKGEKSCPVVFWRFFDDEKPEPDAEGWIELKKTRCMVKYYNVFNVSQCDGIPQKHIPVVESYHHNPIAEAQAIAYGMPNAPKVLHGGGRACYAPYSDTVTMPSQERFEQGAGYYATLFHELGHSTGHKTRLNRKTLSETGNLFGSADYSREELVAEMAAAYLCGECGISPLTLENTAAYLAGWIQVLREDSRAVITAAAQAQKAADYILNRTP